MCCVGVVCGVPELCVSSLRVMDCELTRIVKSNHTGSKARAESRVQRNNPGELCAYCEVDSSKTISSESVASSCIAFRQYIHQNPTMGAVQTILDLKEFSI